MTAEPHCDSCTCFEVPLSLEDIQGRRKAATKKRRSGLKRDSKDAAWSKMVRERAGMRCQFVILDRQTGISYLPPNLARCDASIEGGLAPQGLHAAHCFTRGNPRTRLDPDNGLAMCWPHHREIDGDKSLRFAIFRWWLGDERFDALEGRAKARRDR